MTENKKLIKTIDVLVPVYNGVETIQECLDSIFSQASRGFEIKVYVCNDASTDNTKNVLSKYIEKKSIIYFENKVNLGYLRTFNKLLGLSTSEYIAFLDSDDKYESEKIKNQFEFLENNEDISLVGVNFFRFTKKAKINTSKLPVKHNEILSALLDSKESVCCSSLMIRREVYLKIGGYREYFIGKVGEDVDWILRAVRYFKIENIEFVGYGYRMRSNSLSRIVSYDVEKIHVHDFILDLYRYRLNKNEDNDYINDVEKVRKYFESWNFIYENNPIGFINWWHRR